MTYTVEWKPSASKALRKLDPPIRRQVIAAVEDLRSDPWPEWSTALVGAPAGCVWRRVRAGDYRVVYEIQSDQLIVVVLRVGHRREVYRHLT